MKINSKDKLFFFDTTLRDGEQSPGASMNLKEKLLAAHQIAALGVDIIEAGFPISSQGDFDSVKIISQQIKTSSIAGLCRAHEKDINACWNAVKFAKKPRIHILLATSDLHMKKKLRKTRNQVLEMAIKAVKYGKSLCNDIEFSAEDAGRSDMNFLYKIIEAVIDAGATTINIPDTVGYSLPIEFGEKIEKIKKNVPNINNAIISVHCHNDLGLAVANSLSAIENGARQIECTINGIGERAGNASLEEIAMILKVRSQYYANFKNSIKTKEIYNTSKLISKLTGISVQINKAIVGANAFAHESGIHQDGILKDRETYEIMSPSDIGVLESSLILGKHSGRHALFKKIKDLGYKLKNKTLEQIFEKFKTLADKKKKICDEDVIALIEGDITSSKKDVFVLDYLNTTSGTKVIPTATIKILKNKKPKPIIFRETAYGSGPIEAVYKAINKIINIDIELKDFLLRAVSFGKDALGEVMLKIEYNGIIYSGKGVSTDIIEASAKAYIQAINKIELYKINNKKT